LTFLVVFPGLYDLGVFPDSARVIFRPCDYSITFVVESTRENIVFVPSELLDLLSSVTVPNSAGLVN